MQKYLTTFLCGFISGFAVLIPSNTLNFWLSTRDIDIRLIGAFSLVSLPYAINFIWAPIFDTIRIPLLFKVFGQRLSWIYLLQICLAILVYLLSAFDPTQNLLGMAICAFFVSIMSSSQDTALGALRSEIIEPSKQGSVAGTYIVGYRAGMLLSSSGAILASVYMDWHSIYKIFAVIILCFPVILGLLPSLRGVARDEATQSQKTSYTNGLRDKDFIESGLLSRLRLFAMPSSHKSLLLILIFLVLYRLPDNFINAMVNPFLLHIGFDAIEIATVGKFLGVMAAILGGLIASRIMNRISVTDSLLYFGIIHAIAHSFFIAQNIIGYNLPLLFVVMGFESITSGMAMAAYIAFITSLCKGKYRATQYAFLSSMMGLSRAILPGISGIIVSEYGWQAFYFFASIATIPSLAILWFMKQRSQASISE